MKHQLSDLTNVLRRPVEVTTLYGTRRVDSLREKYGFVERLIKKDEEPSPD